MFHRHSRKNDTKKLLCIMFYNVVDFPKSSERLGESPNSEPDSSRSLGGDFTCTRCHGRRATGFSTLVLDHFDPHSWAGCGGRDVTENHACADISDVFLLEDELPRVPEMLSHPDIALLEGVSPHSPVPKGAHGIGLLLRLRLSCASV